MKRLEIVQWVCLAAHLVSLVFGLAGLVIVLPHPELVADLPPLGQRLFQLSMAGGGMVYILLGAIAVAIWGYRVMGGRPLALFMVPALGLSLLSELVGTSTGFPFGHYAYLSGLGYKVAGLVPFTIPLSWFYLGLAAYLLAYSGLRAGFSRQRVGDGGVRLLAVGGGAVLLTAWDLVLDPAMSQAAFPFWYFQEVGVFFGMPYRNLLGWVGTGAIFMGIAALFWRRLSLRLSRQQLVLPLVVYLMNFAFGAVITVAQLPEPFGIPVRLGVLVGVIPAILCWQMAPLADVSIAESPPEQDAVAGTPELISALPK